MSGAALYTFREAHGPSKRLADQLGLACRDVHARRFPDGESLVRVPDSVITPNAILYRSLDNPNRKIVEVLLAASALRDGGARRVILVAPYLAYMRQDMAFRSGEAVSQKVVGTLLARAFDAVVTVDPHLHRIASLEMAVPGIPVRTVAAATAIAEMIRRDLVRDTVLVGPDGESTPWVAALAGQLGVEWMVGEKQRMGDRTVVLKLPDPSRLRERPVIIVDDVLSSGGTMLACADQVRSAGARKIEGAVTHCLARKLVISGLLENGFDRVRSADSVPGPTNAASLAPLLAAAVSDILHEFA